MHREERRERRDWFIAYAVCAIGALLPLLVTYRLPMADLPQHAAQATILRFFDAACYDFGALFEINWTTPYLLGTLIAALLGSVKLTTFLAIAALPLALRHAARYAGIDPWLALLGFPVAFGFAFYWGFLTFMLTVPLVIVAAVEVHRSTEPGAPRRVARLLLLSFAIVVCHALGFAALLLITLPIVCVRALRDRRALPALFAVMAPLPLFLLWAASESASAPRARVPLFWDIDASRLRGVLDHLLAAGGDVEALLASMALVVIVFVSGARFSKDWTRWLGFVAALAWTLLAPRVAMGQTFLFERFTVLVFATLFLALEPSTKPILRPPVLRMLVVVFVLLWSVVLVARFHRFHADARGFDELVDRMRTNQRVLLLNLDARSDAVSGMPFLHFSGYYQERKGGVIGWSFSSNFPSVVRYRRGITEGVPNYITYDPRHFDMEKHGAYRYFIVRSPADIGPLLFGDDADRVVLRGRSGLWWLYERPDFPLREECTPLTPDGKHQPLMRLGR
ncbi:MAG TPA: hypothetical protein VM779_09455 [Thermoanaerobaculia bacterium]|nr:hypothetical protein [Thermoanaerobaculia bacterium]